MPEEGLFRKTERVSRLVVKRNESPELLMGELLRPWKEKRKELERNGKKGDAGLVEKYAKSVPKWKLDKKIAKEIKELKKAAANPKTTKKQLALKEKRLEAFCLVWSAKNHFVQEEEGAGISQKKQGFVKKALKRLNLI